MVRSTGDLWESETRSVSLGPANKLSIYFNEVDKGGQLFSSELREAFSSLGGSARLAVSTERARRSRSFYKPRSEPISGMTCKRSVSSILNAVAGSRS